jgi:hypothetical protein
VSVQHICPSVQSPATWQWRPNMHIASGMHLGPALDSPQHASPAAQSSGPSQRSSVPVHSTRAAHAIVSPADPDVTEQMSPPVHVTSPHRTSGGGPPSRAVELLGARCVLSGLQPAVAQTLVELGVSFGGLETQRNLRHALESCQGARRTDRTVQKRRRSGNADA